MLLSSAIDIVVLLPRLAAGLTRLLLRRIAAPTAIDCCAPDTPTDEAPLKLLI